LKIWLDTGTAEPGWEQARNLCAALVERGWNLHDDLEYHEIEGADHSEAAWGARVDPMLRFLYPPIAPKPATHRLALAGAVGLCAFTLVQRDYEPEGRASARPGRAEARASQAFYCNG